MSKNRKTAALILLAAILVFTLPLVPFATPVLAQGAGGNLGPNNGVDTIKWAPELYPNWKYRIKLNVSEPGVANRVNEPVNIYLTFNDNQAKLNSFRVMMYNSSGWFNVTTQVWNYTLYQPSGFVKSATITFLVNMTKSQSSVYYLYYTDQAVPSIQYKSFVTCSNGSFKSPNTNIDIRYTDITAQTYRAQVAWEYGYLTDFWVNNLDLIGEYYRRTYPIEVGAITDFNNVWAQEALRLPYNDKAELVEFTSGPIFTRIALNKTTTYYTGYPTVIYRVWTFYPNYWTLDVNVKFTYTEYYLVYSRLFHNGSRTYYPSLEYEDNVIDGATITLKYYQGGQNYTKTATINSFGGTEGLQVSLTIPYWYAVYKSTFAYSCIPASGSEVNYFYYYDADSKQNPYNYGAAGWAYYGTPISTAKSWSARIVYTPHEGQSNSSFAEIDYLKIYNPLNVQKFSAEYYRDNQVYFKLVDYSNNPVADVKLQLYNVSGSQFVGNSTTNSSGVALYTKLYDYTYNLTVWYDIGGSERNIASVSSLSFTANYTRTASFKIDCSVNLARIKLLEGKFGEPLYNYTIIINSTTNSLNLTVISDDYGWHNISLPITPNSLYGITVKNPAGVLKADNISVVDIKIVTLIIVNVTEPDALTSLTIVSYSIQIYPGTNPAGRSTPSQLPVEIYWGDSLTFTVEFKNLTGNTGITDASTRNWSIYYENMTLVSAGSATHWIDGKYNFTLSSSDYGNSWGKTLYLKIEFKRIGCVTPPVLTIQVNVKAWDTSISTSPVNSAWAYWRENITILVNYYSNLTDSLLDLSYGTLFTAYVSGVDYTGYFSNYPNNNGTVTLSLNLTNQGLGVYTVIITASLTHYISKQVSLQLYIVPLPTYGSWSSTSLYMYDSGGVNFLKGAFAEDVPITVEAYSNATQNHPSEPLIGGVAIYVWEKGAGQLNEAGAGLYNGTLTLTGLTSEDEGIYTLTVIVRLENRTELEFYINLEVIQSWTTKLTLIARNPEGSIPWGNNITLTFKYECIENPRNGLTLEGAGLSFEWPTGYWYYVDKGAGLYDIILNSSAYSITGNTRDILLTKTVSMSKQYYASNISTVAIGITRIPGIVNLYVGEVKNPSEFYVIALENKTVNLDFIVYSSYSIFNNQPIKGANLIAVIKPRSGGDWNITAILPEIEPGVYRLTINSTQIQRVVNEPYYLSISIYAQKDNYIQQLSPQEFYFTLRPIKVASSIIKIEGGKIEGSLITANAGEQVILRFKVEDSDHSLSITSATVTALLQSGSQTLKSYSARHIGGGVYEFTISTTELDGSYTLILEVSAGDNYSTLTVAYTLQVIVPFPLMLLVIIAAASAVSIPLGYKGVKYYQWVKKPIQVKKILTSIDYIKKMKSFKITSPISREENIKSKLEKILLDPSYEGLRGYIAPPVTKIDSVSESSTIYSELSNRVNQLLPELSSAEKSSLIQELINLPPDERELLLKSIVEERGGKTESKLEEEFKQIESAVSKPSMDSHSKILDELSRMVSEGLITEEEKQILSLELADLPVEEQNKFLERLKSRGEGE
ncbi:MAG: hypothetical protein OdinLCB4_001125 [Candidatus Odinarchaeum yellowstonii]|uniref:Uncharacterized protein n=1 Tax=Odinarchaeota yellowstonii (strain LCB_4) TaxID=1841599 RepID=A0AAF0D2Q3_ODILC|nr:MAG: hypothetical protein OdinLCB4_001125 [Candidatus Odinarchaeum yellowstonii]